MAETVVTGNEFLDLLPIVNLEHLRDVTAQSSPMTTPGPTAHVGAAPDAGAKGAV